MPSGREPWQRQRRLETAGVAIPSPDEPTNPRLLEKVMTADRPTRKPAPRPFGPRTYEQPDLDSVPLNPKRWRYVLNLILARHAWRHSTRNKGVGYDTIAEHGRLIVWMFRFLREHPKRYRLDPRSFTGRHVDCVMGHWAQEVKAGRLKPSTIQNYASQLRTFTGWIGKPRLVKPMSAYFDDAALYARHQNATEDKAWRAKGVDVMTVVSDVEGHDRYAAAALRLMHAFHLRFKESLMFRPNSDVLTAAQAGRDDAGVDAYLRVHRGTKGGRPRLFPIDNELRRSAIEFARCVAPGPNDSISDPRLDLKRAMRRLRYVMERFGITRADLGVTPHGLRHQGAATDYEAMTGEKPPVTGGKPVAKEVDAKARQEIAERLGHGRVRIASMYLGQSVVMRSKDPKPSDPPAT
jgi:integrase